tara:strand:- start:416 stop:1084 length:669 start_codon:yes stop_codon:yes gene_type:complete
MCFSENMSLLIFILGTITTLIIKKYNNKFILYFPVFYFSLMELFQYLAYVFIRKKKENILQLLNYLIYIHISFQSFVINLWFLNYIPKKNIKIMYFVLKICLISSIFYISRLYNTNINNLCDVKNEETCGNKSKLELGKKHILYIFRMRGANYLTPSIFIHFFLWFIPALLLNVNKIIYLSSIVGIFGTLLITKNKDEYASIWCFINIPLMILSLLSLKYFK